jgi:maleate isomerase
MQDLSSNVHCWEQPLATYTSGPGSRASLGLIQLATDRVSDTDTRAFLSGLDNVDLFSTRIPMSDRVTTENLRAVEPYLSEAAQRIVPQSRLDGIGFSCTSGTVAIGIDVVHEAIKRGRPGTPVTTPIEAAILALRTLSIRRIAFLAPYQLATARLVADVLERSGFDIVRKATFGLDGDLDMNRLSAECLIKAGSDLASGGAEALFISCTGVATFPVVARLEGITGKPVVTSNQALAWHLARLSGVDNVLPDRGRLFEYQVPRAQS